MTGGLPKFPLPNNGTVENILGLLKNIEDTMSFVVEQAKEINPRITNYDLIQSTWNNGVSDSFGTIKLELAGVTEKLLEAVGLAGDQLKLKLATYSTK